MVCIEFRLKKAWECAQRLMSKYNLTMPSIENEEILESNKGADSNKRRASLFLSSESDTPQPLPISEMQKASNFPAMHQRLKSGSTPTVRLHLYLSFLVIVLIVIVVLILDVFGTTN